MQLFRVDWGKGGHYRTHDEYRERPYTDARYLHKVFEGNYLRADCCTNLMLLLWRDSQKQTIVCKNCKHAKDGHAKRICYLTSMLGQYPQVYDCFNCFEYFFGQTRCLESGCS